MTGTLLPHPLHLFLNRSGVLSGFNFLLHGPQDLYPTYLQTTKGFSFYQATVATIIGNCDVHQSSIFSPNLLLILDQAAISYINPVLIIMTLYRGRVIAGIISQHIGRRLTIMYVCPPGPSPSNPNKFNFSPSLASSFSSSVHSPPSRFSLCQRTLHTVWCPGCMRCHTFPPLIFESILTTSITVIRPHPGRRNVSIRVPRDVLGVMYQLGNVSSFKFPPWWNTREISTLKLIILSPSFR